MDENIISGFNHGRIRNTHLDLDWGIKTVFTSFPTSRRSDLGRASQRNHPLFSFTLFEPVACSFAPISER